MDDLKAKGIKAFAWDYSGQLATQGMGLIVSIFLARLLEPSEFGLIAMIMVIIGIAGVFTDIGLGGALIQRRKVLPVHYSSVFYFNIFIGMILTLITYFSASWIGAFYNNDALVLLAQVMSLSFLINAFSSVQSTKLRKELDYGALTKSRFMASLLSGGAGVALAFYGAGVWSLVTQVLSFSIFYNIMIWSTSQWKPSLSFSFKALAQLWAYGFRMFLSGLLDAVFTRLDYLIIGKLFTPATLGFFQRAKSLNLMVVQYSSGSLMRVLFPILSEVQNDLQRLQRIAVKAMGIICFIVFLLLGGLYLISEELILLLFGDKWIQSVSYFQILVISGFGYPVGALLVNILSSRGKSKEFLRLELLKKALISINFFVLYNWGISSYLYGLIVTTVLAVILNIFFASREISLPMVRFIKPIIIQASISIIAIVTTEYLLKSTDLSAISKLILEGLTFTTIYLLINWTFKTSSFYAFLEQLLPVVKQRFRK